MNRSALLSPFWEQASKDKKTVDFHPTPTDSTHFIVSRFTAESRETIGHIYVEFEGDEFRYNSTNRKGKEIFQPTTDFNLVEMQFERYAHLLALQQKAREHSKRFKILNYNLNLKNTNTMKTQNTAQKTQRQNQLRFIEYEKPTGDGHFITVGDSYHNTIGRVHKSYNEELKKYEYVAFDHAGNLMAKSDKLWEVKNVFTNNREQLLEQAHQRRIESKAQSRTDKENPTAKADQRKAELEKVRGTDLTKYAKQAVEEDMSGFAEIDEEEIEKFGNTSNQENEREQEINVIRNSKDDDRGDMDMDR